MSFLKRQRRILDRIAENSGGRIRKRTEEKYGELEESLARLLNDVRNSPNFPKNAEEVLYDFSGKTDYNELAFVKNLRDTYALTKNGVRKAWELRMDGDMVKKLNIGTIDSNKLTKDHTDPELFGIVCDNIQRIMDKYKIKVDEKKYLKV
jgi:hypothetical protein